MGKNVFYILMTAMLLVIASCAKQGMPSGGPKDETPPKVLGTRPESRIMNFDRNGFQIDFDEYVVVKDAENNILVSPPMRHKPEYKTKGHGIQVKITDTLQPNTTYVFQFREAIADYNEGNLLPSLEYVFSTGSYIDSMTIRGRVVDALSYEPKEEPASVWLLTAADGETFLSTWGDSAAPAPSLAYVTRCNKDGSFQFNYIRPGSYCILAVQDENKNQQLEANESVAFVEQRVESKNMKDSIMVDSTMRCTADTGRLELLIFTPKTENQRVTGSDFKRRGRLTVSSLLPMKNPHIESSEALIWRLNTKRDTLTAWTLRETCDSLQLVLSDSTGLQDTLKLKYKQKQSPAKGDRLKPIDMKLSHSELPYFDTLHLTFSTPLDTARCQTDSVVIVMDLKDSSVTYSKVRIDNSLLRADIEYTFRPGGKYRIDVRKGLLHNIYGKASDTLHATVHVSETEAYGNLILKLDSKVDGPFLVQLLTEKGQVQSTRKATESCYLQFPHLSPAKYRIRAIVDQNGNGEWDGGDFKSQRQPERVVYLSKTLDIRANWEYNEELEIKN